MENWFQRRSAYARAGKLTPIFLGYNTTLHIDGYARVEGSSELMKTTSGNFTLVNSLAIPTAESPVAGDVDPVIHSYDKRNLLPLALPQLRKQVRN